MIRRKYPLEYELSPQTLEKGTRWLVLRLKNIGDSLHNTDINMHSTDSLQISLRKSSNHIFRLRPDEESLLSFKVDAHGTTALYFSVRYFKEGGSFHWDSPWIREQVLGEVAELEHIFVTNSYGTTGRELEAEVTIKGLDSSDGLDLSGRIRLPESMKSLHKSQLRNSLAARKCPTLLRLLLKKKDTIQYMRACTITTEGLVGILT